VARNPSWTGRLSVFGLRQVLGLRGHSGRPPPDHQRQLL